VFDGETKSIRVRSLSLHQVGAAQNGRVDRIVDGDCLVTTFYVTLALALLVGCGVIAGNILASRSDGWDDWREAHDDWQADRNAIRRAAYEREHAGKTWSKTL
jgi:hypothetical protein